MPPPTSAAGFESRPLERAGWHVADALPAALRKDGGATAATIAWVISETVIPDDARLPGGIVPADLRAYRDELITRLRWAALPPA